MARRAASLCLLSALALAVAACSSDSKPENPNQFPKDYKTEIIETLKKLFGSNYTVRVSGAQVSDPVLRTVGKDQIYTACVRYTAHGASAGEIGHAMRVAYFYGGHLNQLVEASQEQCGKAAYKPFPELNKYCVGTGCKESSSGFSPLLDIFDKK
jgi:hypothetical protein